MMSDQPQNDELHPNDEPLQNDDLPQNDEPSPISDQPQDVESPDELLGEPPDEEEGLLPGEEVVEPEPPEPAFEDLTIAQALGLLWRAPITTARAFVAVAQTPSFVPQSGAQS